tara:strand:+ start:2525 stop:3124 length:600 start_codon:yes stop_codon:yes gene_type:complete
VKLSSKFDNICSKAHMKLKFDIQNDDLIYFYKFSEWYSPEKEDFRFKQKLNFGFISFFLPFTTLLFSDQNFNLLFFIGLGFFAIGFFLAKPFMLLRIKKAIKKTVNGNKYHDFIGETKIEFNDDHIQWFDQNSEGKVSINEIDRILSGQYGYYIYLCNLSALIVPKRVFKKEPDLQEFEAWIIRTRSNSSSIKPYHHFE